MPTRRARLRRASPGILPALIALALEVILVIVVLAWRQQQRNLCHAAQFARASNNATLRAPFRQFALDAAAARDASGDHDVAKQYRRIAARVHDLPDLKC